MIRSFSNLKKGQYEQLPITVRKYFLRLVDSIRDAESFVEKEDIENFKKMIDLSEYNLEEIKKNL